MTVYLAPLEGVTDAVFRRVHRDCFSGVAKYFIPFVSPTQNLAFTARDLSILAPENGFGVPQLLCKDAALFLWAAQALGDMGYGEVNLNLGCPSGTVTAKGKGSGLLADVPALERLLDGVFARPPLPVSIKTRIGYTRPDEFDRLLDVFARYPIHELIIHPRTRVEFYKGTPHREAFAKAHAALDRLQRRSLLRGRLPRADAAVSEYPRADARARADRQPRFGAVARRRRGALQGVPPHLP